MSTKRTSHAPGFSPGGVSSLRKASHSVFSIHLHVIFVTKYRRKVLTKAMIEDAKKVFERVLESNSSILSNCEGEADHLHLLIDLHPNNNISNLVSSLKSASSRILRKKYSQEIAQHYWGKNAKLWHDSKCIISCGQRLEPHVAPLEVIKQYIDYQSGGKE